ncbi:MAG TPA: serine hydrolase domain-containing protein [Gallionella sp.]|nr:serine hydrolase domain-containing protein [Gallionella sp.]
MTDNFPYDPTAEASSVNMNPDRIRQVADEFLRQQQQGEFPGGQLVVRRSGKVVLKLACGVARGWQGRGGDTLVKVQDNTPFPVYSTGKPMAAVVIAMLESQGLLDVSQPVMSVLPEFAGLGRDGITILDVLTHRAGIILADLIDNHEIWNDRDAVWQHLLRTPPRYPRSTFAYMPAEYGVILDQLVTRLTGQSIAEVFQSRLAAPLGLRNMHYGLGPNQLDDLAWSYWQGKDRYVIAGMDVADRFEEKNNDTAVFAAGNPAFGMVTDAANLAAFYELMTDGGRTRNGEQIIKEEFIKRYTTRQVSGWNKSVNTYLSLGRGFMLGTLTPSFYGWWGTSGCFGHAGMFSSLAYGDHRTGLSVAIVTNGNKSIGNLFSRFVRITHGLKMACK